MSLLHLILRFTLNLDTRMLCSGFCFVLFYCFFGIDFLFFSFLFSPWKDVMVCYFNFLDSYSENRMLFF